MRPTFAQLEAFYWVARLGSVKEAARQLGLSQPTISLRIDDLEAELGVTLFERAGRGICPTQRGEGLLPRVSAVMEDFARIRATIGDTMRAEGTIRIGVAETFAQACLPDYVRALGTRHPALQLEVVVGTSAELEADVVERRLDIAFAINPAGDPKLTLIPLGIQDVTWAAAPSLDLPPLVRPTDLQEVLIVTNPHPAPMWRQVTDWFRQDGLEPRQVCRCSSVSIVTQLVAEGIGVSLLPRRFIQREIAAGAVVALDTDIPIQPSRLFAIYRFADKSILIDEVIDLARQIIRSTSFIPS